LRDLASSRPGRRPGIDAATAARLKERLAAGAELERDGMVAFRAIDAQRLLKEEFDRDCSLSSTYRLLHRLNLSWLATRVASPDPITCPAKGLQNVRSYRCC